MSGTRAHARGESMPSTHPGAGDAPASDGFSLLELMIATVILGVITAQLFVLAAAQQRGQRQDERRTDVVDSVRRSLDLIASDTRNAGFMVPRYAAVSSTDGGGSRADRLCVSDSNYFDLPQPGGGVTTTLDGRITRFDGSMALGIASTALTLNSLDVDSFGGVDYAAGSGIIVVQHDGAPSPSFPAKGIATHCARIAGVDVTNKVVRIEPLHAIPGGLFIGANVVAVPAHVYEIDDSNGVFTLRRDGIALSEQIEDLQVEYWVDSLGVPDGSIDASGREFPIHDVNSMPLANRDTARIRRVKISLVGRAPLPEENVGFFQRPALANRTAGSSDGFKRDVLTVSLLPANLLDHVTYPNVP
jgi:prepilin-type N-terminal cleavage/methylation domain-containing protein